MEAEEAWGLPWAAQDSRVPWVLGENRAETRGLVWTLGMAS